MADRLDRFLLCEGEAMTIRHVDEATVAQILTPAVLRDLMRRTLAAAARGRARGPTRSIVATGHGWFGTMPALVELDDLQGVGAKLVTFFPKNAGGALPTHQALIAMLDPTTGTFLALVAGETITERRTAAVSAVATERLAARPKGAVAILGAGVQGFAHLEALREAGLIAELRVWSPTAANAERLASRAREMGLTASVFGDAPAAVRSADVIVTATAASEPLFAPEDIADGAHVNAVGACVPSRRELPAELVADANVYADSSEAAWQESGDLLLAARDLGRERITIAAELGEMLAEPSLRHPPKRITIFESLGIGIEDVASAAYVLSRLG